MGSSGIHDGSQMVLEKRNKSWAITYQLFFIFGWERHIAMAADSDFAIQFCFLKSSVRPTFIIEWIHVSLQEAIGDGLFLFAHQPVTGFFNIVVFEL